jgi:hypothetical protein
MGATCSAVISAACHPSLPEDKDASKLYIQRGAVSQTSFHDSKGSTEGDRDNITTSEITRANNLVKNNGTDVAANSEIRNYQRSSFYG